MISVISEDSISGLISVTFQVIILTGKSVQVVKSLQQFTIQCLLPYRMESAVILSLKTCLISSPLVLLMFSILIGTELLTWENSLYLFLTFPCMYAATSANLEDAYSFLTSQTDEALSSMPLLFLPHTFTVAITIAL